VPAVGIATNSIIGCYVAHIQKDMYALIVQSEEKGVITGKIAFNNFEKDDSSGSFTGTFNQNILFGDYSFNSEGMRSDRQLIFKQVGGNFIEGFGNVKTAGDTEMFADINTITYDPNVTFTKSENCTERFNDSSNIFTFGYNPYFKASEGQNIPSLDWRQNTKKQGVLLASVVISRTYMPHTNLSDARFTVGRSTDMDEIKSCMNNAINGEKKGESILIDGYPFVRFSLSDAGAGNLYETTSYRGIVDGDCYVIEYTIHSTNIGNYSPDQGIAEFDKTKLTNELESIVYSLKIKISSN
jgi:hypothetical protein